MNADSRSLSPSTGIFKKGRADDSELSDGFISKTIIFSSRGTLRGPDVRKEPLQHLASGFSSRCSKRALHEQLKRAGGSYRRWSMGGTTPKPIRFCSTDFGRGGRMARQKTTSLFTWVRFLTRASNYTRRLKMRNLVLIGVILTLAACNTVAGAGQDMSQAGHEITGEAQEHMDDDD